MISAVFGLFKSQTTRFANHITSQLASHRLAWNYIYMSLYVILALYLGFFYAEVCGNTVIMTTGGVVTGIFTNVIWSKTYEKKNKEAPPPKVDSSEIGAGD